MFRALDYQKMVGSKLTILLVSGELLFCLSKSVENMTTKKFKYLDIHETENDRFTTF